MLTSFQQFIEKDAQCTASVETRLGSIIFALIEPGTESRLSQSDCLYHESNKNEYIASHGIDMVGGRAYHIDPWFLSPQSFSAVRFLSCGGTGYVEPPLNLPITTQTEEEDRIKTNYHVCHWRTSCVG